MPGQGLRSTMAAQTELVTIILEEMIIIGLMGLVAGHTISISKRLMLHGVNLLGKRLMTAKTTLSEGLVEQTLMIRSMGTVTGQALTLLDRLMLNPLPKGLFGLVMTRVTKLATLLLEQAFILCNMGIMALNTLAMGHWFMDNFTAKILLRVAFATPRQGLGRAIGCRKKNRGRKKYNYTSFHQFPSP